MAVAEDFDHAAGDNQKIKADLSRLQQAHQATDALANEVRQNEVAAKDAINKLKKDMKQVEDDTKKDVAGVESQLSDDMTKAVAALGKA